MVWLEQTCVLIGIQFTQHSIKFVFVKTNQSFGSYSNVILMRQICGQRSRKAAGSKRQALVFWIFRTNCYVFLISKGRGEWDLCLCMTLRLTKRMPLRCGDFRFKNVFECKICRNSPMCRGFFLRILKLCTNLRMTLLYILISKTWSTSCEK